MKRIAPLMLVALFIFAVRAHAQRPKSMLEGVDRAEKSLMDTPIKITATQSSENLVDCNNPKAKFHSINGALAKLDPSDRQELFVSGTCNENVVIQGFDHLTLIALAGASINDPSAGVNDTVDIIDSREVGLRGFIINGGAAGVFCLASSLCRFENNTIQNSIGDGIDGDFSEVTTQSDTLQNNAGAGVFLTNNARMRANKINATGNQSGAVVVRFSSFVNCRLCTIQNNQGDGFNVTSGASIRLIGTTISGNTGAGVRLFEGGIGRFNFSGGTIPNVITGNFGNGVVVRDLSFARFAGNDSINGNAGLDVSCQPQFPATRGVFSGTGGATTNCVEP